MSDGDIVRPRQCVSPAAAALTDGDASALWGSPNMLPCAYGHTGLRMDENLHTVLKG